MTKLALRTRVIILTISPALIIGMLLGGYFLKSLHEELEQQFSLAGRAVIEPLAIIVGDALAAEETEMVRRLLSNSHRQQSQFIRNITVFNKNNHVFASSSYHRNLEELALPDGVNGLTELRINLFDDNIVLRQPIYPVDDYLLSQGRLDAIGYIVMELDIASLRLEEYQEMISVILVGLLSLLFAGLFAYRLLLDVEKPIKQMINMIDKIRRGHLDVRIEGQLIGELNRLKNGINAMAMALSEYYLEMQQSIDQATSDLRETLEQLEIQNIELDIAKKHAQEAAQIKSDFIANMSHELRTPLNSVIGFTRQMLKTSLSQNQQDYLHTIERSANNLLAIINDILDFSKLEAGKLQLESIDFDLVLMVEEIMEQLAPMAHAKRLELLLIVDGDIPKHLIGDPLRIQQVLSNLISNATKFTQQGWITVTLSQQAVGDDVLVKFSVKDTGVGIDEQLQSELFQAFRQADASISRHYGGTGLGLVITKQLVKEMSGELGFTSQPQQGSDFWFSLQLEQSENPDSLAPIALEKAQRIYLIDDVEQNRAALLSRLTQQGLSVEAYAELPQTDEAVYAVIYSKSAQMQLDIHSLSAELERAKRLTQRVIFCLPSTEIVLSEQLLSLGASACVITPVAVQKLLRLLMPQESETLGNRGESAAIEQQEDGRSGHNVPLLNPLQQIMQQPTQQAIQQQMPHLPILAAQNAPPLVQAEAQAAPCCALQVLAVDDNMANLKLLNALLQQNEHVVSVSLASSGKEAIRLAKQHAFSLVLMDIQMPELDGLATCQEIRKIPLHAKTPVIAVTAHAMQGEREQLLAKGMNDYLTKPLDEAHLIQVVKKWGCDQQTTTGINWQLAMKYAVNKADLAYELLGLLVNSFPEVEAAVHAALAGDEQGLLASIHKLHGGCAYSGVCMLQHLCHQLETALKQGASAADLEPELFELLDEMEKVKLQATPLFTPQLQGVTDDIH